MKSQRRVIILATKIIKSSFDSLKSTMQKKNGRLIQKYVTELKSALNEMLKALVSTQIEEVDDKETWIVEARAVEELGQTMLFEAEEYLLYRI